MSKPERLIKSVSGAVNYYDFDEFRLDLKRGRLLRNGEPVTLTNKAFRTLLILVENAGELVEKETIYDELWGENFVEDSNLTQYVYILRKVLGKNREGTSYIETVARRGYRFVAEVTAAREPPRGVQPQKDGTAEHDLKAAPSHEGNDVTEPFRLRLVPQTGGAIEPAGVLSEDRPVVAGNARTTRRLLYAALALLVIAAAVIAAVFFFRAAGLTRQDTTAARSIVVLPGRPTVQHSDDAALPQAIF